MRALEIPAYVPRVSERETSELMKVFGVVVEGCNFVR